MKIVILALVTLFPISAALGAPLYELEQPSAQQLRDLYEVDDGRYAFAVAVDAAVDSDVDGAWQQQGDRRIWRAELQAPGASSLSFQFDVLAWPAGAQLTLRAADGSQQGPYTQQHLRDGQLWTSMLLTDAVTVEWQMPVDSAARLRLAKAHYGVRNASGYYAKHGSCNNDVVCAVGDPYADQIDSTVLLQIPAGGSSVFLCSGFLVNNTRGDRAPYILTADHCSIDQSNQAGVQVYWRFQDSSCGNSFAHGHPAPDPSFSRSGVEVLASGDRSDFSLLVVGTAANPATIPASFQPYWSGWDIGNTAASNGVGVHHPSGDEKSISVFNSPVTAVVASIDGRATDSWRVTWNDGTTEQGSSGSGLWNEDGRAVGVLSGGGASCTTPSNPDFYGRLNVAWQEFGVCDGQLKYWLDPDFSEAQTSNGVGAGAAAPQIPACVSGTPVSTPGPTPTPVPTVLPTPSPTPQATTTPTPTPVVVPTSQPTPVATPTPSSAPTPQATASASPAPTNSPVPTQSPGRQGGGAGGLGLALLAGLSLLRRRNMMRPDHLRR